MENKGKLFVVFKKQIDEYDNCISNFEISAVCDNAQKALEILKNELELCKKRRLSKSDCLLYVEIFPKKNQPFKKKKRILNIFEFAKLVELIT